MKNKERRSVSLSYGLVHGPADQPAQNSEQRRSELNGQRQRTRLRPAVGRRQRYAACRRIPDRPPTTFFAVCAAQRVSWTRSQSQSSAVSCLAGVAPVGRSDGFVAHS